MAVVTISRQVGSLGDELAQGLARELDYHLVTAPDMRALAVSYDPRFAPDMQDLERERGLGLLERLFFSQPVYHSLYAAVILELASRGRTIILGRGAQVVLSQLPQVLRVRVVAPARVRTARLAASLGASVEEAQAIMERHDQERRALVRQIFDHDLRDWGLYNLVLNTEGLDVAAAVKVVGQCVSELLRLHPSEEVGRRLAELALAKRVEASLRREILRSNLLKAELDDAGRLVLSGYLHGPRETRQALELARALAPGRELINRLQVSSFSLTWPA